MVAGHADRNSHECRQRTCPCPSCSHYVSHYLAMPKMSFPTFARLRLYPSTWWCHECACGPASELCLRPSSQVVVTLASVFLMDSAGRRALLLYSSIGMIVATCLLTTGAQNCSASQTILLRVSVTFRVSFSLASKVGCSCSVFFQHAWPMRLPTAHPLATLPLLLCPTFAQRLPTLGTFGLRHWRSSQWCSLSLVSAPAWAPYPGYCLPRCNSRLPSALRHPACPPVPPRSPLGATPPRREHLLSLLSERPRPSLGCPIAICLHP